MALSGAESSMQKQATSASSLKHGFPTRTVIVVLIIFAFAGTAFGLSLAAFLDSRGDDGHQDLVRRNVVVARDLVVRNDARFDGQVYANSNLYVEDLVDAQVVKCNRLNQEVFRPVITQTSGSINLDAWFQQSNVIAITTPGVYTFSLVLPPATSYAGETFRIMISQAAVGLTLQLAVSSGNSFVNLAGASTLVNPVQVFPRNAGEPDSFLLYNDGTSVWYVK